MEDEGECNILDDLGWPQTVILVFLGNTNGVDLYGCVNVTPDKNDPSYTVNCLAAFIDEEEATIYKAKSGLSGTNVTKTFEEARKIAKSKPTIMAIAIQRFGNSHDLHYVR